MLAPTSWVGGSCHKGYSTLKEAEQAWEEGEQSGEGRVRGAVTRSMATRSMAKIGGWREGR